MRVRPDAEHCPACRRYSVYGAYLDTVAHGARHCPTCHTSTRFTHCGDCHETFADAPSFASHVQNVDGGVVCIHPDEESSRNDPERWRLLGQIWRRVSDE